MNTMSSNKKVSKREDRSELDDSWYRSPVRAVKKKLSYSHTSPRHSPESPTVMDLENIFSARSIPNIELSPNLLCDMTAKGYDVLEKIIYINKCTKRIIDEENNKNSSLATHNVVNFLFKLEYFLSGWIELKGTLSMVKKGSEDYYPPKKIIFLWGNQSEDFVKWIIKLEQDIKSYLILNFENGKKESV